jgi:REP element-mobilizing transposase RayT
MARLARLEIPGGWYHIINRGHQRRAIFRDRRCYEDFLKRLGQLPQRFGVRIHSYVLMPNHYHVQVEVGVRPALSTAMHWLNTGYGIWFNRRFGRVGALFQGRYRAILFDPEDCLLAIHYYIHLNPVRVGALKMAEKQSEPPEKSYLNQRREILRDYEWSSYRAYAGLAEAPKWLSPRRGKRAHRSIPAKVPPGTGSAYHRASIGLGLGRGNCSRDLNGQEGDGWAHSDENRLAIRTMTYFSGMSRPRPFLYS